MAVFNDLVVSGASSFVGPIKGNTIQIDSLKIPASSGSTTYSTGTAGQILKTNGTTLYWDAQTSTYSHPTHTAYSSGLYKITVNSLGHVTAATAVTKADITGLGIPAQDTTYTYATSASEVANSSSPGSATTVSRGDHVHGLPLRLRNAQSSGYDDANNAVDTGFHYMTSGSTNKPPFTTNATDYRILTTAYSASWLQQIATNFRNNEVYFRRNEQGSWKDWTRFVLTDGSHTLSGENTFTGKTTFTGSMHVSGRYYGSGDDEGLIIGAAANGYSGLILGSPTGKRSVFYLSTGKDKPWWRFNDGTNNYDIDHPGKSGTIALVGDAPTAHTHDYIAAKANYTFTGSTLPNSFDLGVSAGFVADNAGYGSYGSVLNVRTYTGGGGSFQLYAPYSPTYGGTRLKARFGNYDSSSGNSWTSLRELAWHDEKLNKLTYEWNKEYSASGTAGYLLIGSFPMYDTNVTIDIDATTTTTAHGTVVIATQNVTETSIGSAKTITVYGDPTGAISDAIRVTWASGSRNYNVYFAPSTWSKNLIHIRAIGQFMNAIDETKICTQFTAGTAPATTSGLTVVNALKSNFTNNSGYTHPAGSGASKSSGFYKFSTDSTSHISGVTAVTKADITALGIPGSDTNTTYTIATGDANGQIKVTPSSGSAYNVAVKGLGSNAYTSTAYLPLAGGNISGHVYFTGSSASSSTGNTSQIVFGTSSSNHIAISSNTKALVLNPTTSSTTNQIVLYLDSASLFPSGIQTSIIKAPTSSGGSTYGVGSSGQVLKSNGTTVYWASDSNTKNTAGSTDTSSKIFLVGATSQASSAQTYSHDTVYVDTDGHLYSNSQKVLNATNYTDYTVKKDGTGASGTWGINISGNAATASAVAWGNVTGKPSTFTPASHTHSYVPYNGQSSYNCNTIYDAGIYMISSGSNCPSGSQYGSLFMMPYRQGTGNTTPDFGTQIFIPNGDDSTKPNSMFFRTATRESWNAWQEVSTAGHTHSYLPLSGGTLSGNVTVSQSSGSVIMSVNNTSVGKINLQVSDSGNRGIYNSTAEKWLIYSGSDNVTKVAAGQTNDVAGVRNIKIIPPSTVVTAGSTAITTGEVWMQYEA